MQQNGGSGFKRLIGLAILAFSITLAVIIGRRMSTEAMAVVIGVACGVLASIPTSLLILAVIRRGDQQVEWRQPTSPSPPVIIVQGGEPRRLELPELPRPAPRWQSTPRQFEVVGQAVTFPGELGAGQYLVYEGEDTGTVCDANWNVVHTVRAEGARPTVAPGMGTVRLTCEPLGQLAATVRLSMMGDAETVRKVP